MEPESRALPLTWERANSSASVLLETPQPAVPNAVADVVEKVAAHFNYQGPTGVAFPAVVKHGVTYTAANVDRSWIGTNAGELFSRHVGGPVTVVNDADAAGIAEIRFGAGRDRKGVVILLTLGTGIGSAIFLNGELIPNTEFGHLIIRGKEAEKRASEKVREDKKLSCEAVGQTPQRISQRNGKAFLSRSVHHGRRDQQKGGQIHSLFLTTKTEVIVVPALMRNEAGIIGAAYLSARFGGVGGRPVARDRSRWDSPTQRRVHRSNCLYAKHSWLHISGEWFAAPTGTVSFLFTDIVGSTRLVGKIPPVKWPPRSPGTMS